MDNQENETTSTTADTKKPDDSEPTPERLAELRKAYEDNVARGKPPYAGVVLRTRGEVRWIIGERRWTQENPATRDEVVDLRDVGLRGNFRGSDFGFANLQGVYIDYSDLRSSNFTGTLISEAYINGSNFSQANLVMVDFQGTTLIDSDFADAQLGGCDLSNTYILGATKECNFERAGLRLVNLRGATLSGNFEGADLTRVQMDAGTILGGYGLPAADMHAQFKVDIRTRLLDVSWNGANLALVNWDPIVRLGDETTIKDAKTRTERLQAYREVARAYCGLAKALETQALTSPALRYRRRQHQLERAAQLRSFNLLGWLFSNALNIVSGYGDRPLRALGVYLAVILAFTGIYFGITTPGSPIFFGGSQPLQLHEAVVFSLSSFHGRGFFPSTIGLGDPVAIVAALEAVVGLFIELVLIATFTRRLFER